MGSARNGSSLLGLPQFPSSNVELGAVSVRNRSAAPGGTGRWPAPRPAFLSREAGEASEGPGATRHVGSQAPSRRVLGRRRSHDIPSARRGSVSRVRGAGGAGKDARRRLPGRRRQEAEAESARAGRTLRISPGLVLPDGLREDGRAVSLRNHLRAVSLATPLHSTPAVGAPRRGSPRLSPVSLPPQ